jgi:peptidoglycan-N-acetylglucosamine deacetylase
LQSLLRKISGVPWGFVALFDLAALVALGMASALLLASPIPGKNPPVTGDKRIALTFDDAPRGPGAFLEPDARAQLLRTALKRASVKQAAFFVNPGRIGEGGRNERQILAFAQAGHVLANHTANHLALSNVSADRFIADIGEAEKWLKGQPGYRPWFRFPQLDEGNRNHAKRDAVRAALKKMGLRNGYVTADGWDWFLENLAIKARKAGKPMDLDALRKLYVETHVQSADFADSLARRTLGRAPAQVLLLHETDLGALYIEDLVKALRADGWTIITADEAYADPIGKLPPPVKAAANGTLIQMLSWERGTKGPRWFSRNEPDEMTKLFNERVLQAK